jgi:dihydroorotate dehydrogenase electron transfer subunit
MNRPKIVEIHDVYDESKDIKTIIFKDSHEMIPGQFFMIWIPKIDEIPMSVSYIDQNNKGITFRRIGDATNALFDMKKGDKIGIRGPYGNGFRINGENILLIGGGTGVAMLAPAIEIAYEKNIQITAIIGAKTKDELFFENRIKKSCSDLIITTDDGSKGNKGYATDILADILKENKFSSILTCGPERMMKTIIDIAGKIPVQASLERYMKCGVGICSQCSIGNGLRVCVEGPVFNTETLLEMEDFGHFKRDASGCKVRI